MKKTTKPRQQTQGITTNTMPIEPQDNNKTTQNNNKATNKSYVYSLKAGTRKQTQQSSFLVLTIFQCSIRKLRTKALLITVQ
jgi:hypothetical protein